ncbi:hypothetical protein AAHW03_19540 [Klebsiella pneumoniae]|uniref:hypothetical protein n=1 Tax=Klebsiella pneumoniae TaxID=573 RepID=UPI0007CCAC54|nr:hypothetical protein [Klebsiella pneumoniae]MDZ5912530.1 hypothetical protein [Klebsiella pneumoniae]SAT39325.1 Uncharacterised protein [Klebsiella pneumoniae]VAQ41593.1 Uncharacterised protein [Klebsiella pneumoniae]VAR84859.1 Uncharacterised protein [Klebsiella pneumoniae]VAR88658.1 Uncharacterised protein [Klebsiella pneumoniae]
MTKSNITRERLEELAAGQSGFNLRIATHEESQELARMALAAMDSEPVAWTWHYREQWHVTNDEERARDLAWDGVKVEPLYRHAQQPVAHIPVLYKGAELLSRSGLELIRDGASFATDLESACMAEALLSAPQPAPEYPETLPCPVLLEPGLRFGKGIKTSTMLAALARRAVHESDMAALSPEERAEFQAGIEDFKALIAQPAPVENHIGSKNALDAIVSFIKSKSNPTVKCYEEVSEQLFKDNCHGIHSHVIEYILKLGEELEDLRAEQDEEQPAPVVPDDVLAALQKVARIRLDLNDFDGDRRGIADCLGDAEEALIEVVNRRAAMLNGGKS